MTQMVVLSGLSGAGRSVAAGALEDLGWFVIDNLPPALLPKVAELAEAGGRYDKVCLVVGSLLPETVDRLAELRQEVDGLTLVFLEASSPVLVRRYESTKRRHPLADDDRSVTDAIEAERAELRPLRQRADEIIDTTHLNPHQLRDRMTSLFGADDPGSEMRVTVSSFGFKHGIPLDVDLVLDCRFLPNPYWDPNLRSFSGKDPEVQEYVLSPDVGERFLDNTERLLVDALPAYADEGKSYLTVAFGCTGGRHRSVAVAENMAARLKNHGWTPRVHHRDIDR